MKEAQVIAKTWKRRMRNQISNEDQMCDYQDFNRNYGDVYNMIQEQQAEEEEDEDGDGGEERKRPARRSSLGRKEAVVPEKKKKSKGIFGKLGDKISAGLFKASKMNKHSLHKQ
jgi:hypothetical protein